MVSKRKVGSIKPNGGQRGVSRSGRGDDTPRLNPASDPRPRGGRTRNNRSLARKRDSEEHPVKNKLNKLDKIDEAGGATDPRGTRPKEAREAPKLSKRKITYISAN